MRKREIIIRFEAETEGNINGAIKRLKKWLKKFYQHLNLKSFEIIEEDK